MHSVYFAKSLKNGKVYVGKTAEKPEVRVQQHNSASNIWTKANGPFKLIYFEEYECEKDASKRESFYKMGFGKIIKKIIVEEIESAQFRPKDDQPMAEARASH